MSFTIDLLEYWYRKNCESLKNELQQNNLKLIKLKEYYKNEKKIDPTNNDLKINYTDPDEIILLKQSLIQHQVMKKLYEYYNNVLLEQYENETKDDPTDIILSLGQDILKESVPSSKDLLNKIITHQKEKETENKMLIPEEEEKEEEEELDSFYYQKNN